MVLQSRPAMADDKTTWYDVNSCYMLPMSLQSALKRTFCREQLKNEIWDLLSLCTLVALGFGHFYFGANFFGTTVNLRAEE